MSEDFGVENFSDDIFQKNPGELEPSISYVVTDGAAEEIGSELSRQAWTVGTTEDGRPIRDEIASAIDAWSRTLSTQMGGTGSNDSMFFRNRYSMSTNPYDQMLQCADACEYDEGISAVLDSTEGMAFQRIGLECVDADQQDVWQQLCDNLKLRATVRGIWRELYKVSQCYVGIWWEKQSFTVRTKNVDVEVIDGDGLVDALNESAAAKKRKRRKTYEGLAPTALTIFDPTKIMPVGNLMFGRQRYAYLATKQENEAFYKVFNGETRDPMAFRMLEGPYTPSPEEKELVSKGSRTCDKYFWLFRPEAIIRVCLSKAEYERFSPVRLKSVLPLLDIKTHLRASDRAHLIGATNFIIVLTRGSDKLPAKAGEIEQLRDQARVVARMPILIGDHRLKVEIITPKMDYTLNREKYDTIDERIFMRALGTFRTGGNPAGRSETAGDIGAIVMRNIESRRNKIAEDLEQDLFQLIIDQNDGNPKFLTEIPNIQYHPRRVTLSTDANVVNAVMQLRDRGDISRGTALEEFDYDQEVEYIKRLREKPMDKVFQSSVPHSSPTSNPYSAGRSGGRPVGSGKGGTQSPASPKPPRASNGSPTPGGDD